ncbi:MAG: SPFH domain-containing protein [Deltaproteobacteria bacterium]|nr:MAG: SPFH domain-containing protein [Deltaproteobacteria bacterium]
MAVFLEIIEWFDETGSTMVHRIPEKGSAEIKMGAQLVVRENQAAIFFRDGKAYDILGPGRHTLSTLNLPLLTKVLSIPFGTKSPFRIEIYFANTKIFTHLKWGTKEPVAFRDSELGLVRLRGFGTYTMRITQPLLCLNTLVGTQGIYSTTQIEDFLRDVIVSRVNDLLGEMLDTVFNLPRYYDELAVAIKSRVQEDFARYGISLLDFYINSITPPAEVQKMIDARAGMQAVGNLDQFMKFKAAKALGDAALAENGGEAASGMGLGLGAGLGMLIPGMLQKTMQEGHLPAKEQMSCPACQAQIATDSRFCFNCGHQILTINKCFGCEHDLPAGANFCMHCGVKVERQSKKCRKCGYEALAEAKFCNRCGEQLP